jgi:hypothetical protein
MEAAGEAKFALMRGPDVLTDPGVTPVVSAGPKKLARDSSLSRPGDGWPVEGVHPGWKVTTLHPPDFSPKVSALAFAPDGKLLVATFDPPEGKRRTSTRASRASSTSSTRIPPADPSAIKYTTVADHLMQPQGMLRAGTAGCSSRSARR